MKRFLVLGLLGLGLVCAARAQQTADPGNWPAQSPQVNFADTSAAKVTLFDPAETASTAAPPSTLSSPSSPAPSAAFATPGPDPAAAAEPAPQPKFLYGGRDDYRWQLGIGADFIRFRSSIFNASAVGVKVSVTYFTNDWFGIEGNVSADFAPQIFDKEHVKVLVYGAGPKVVWRQKRWEPWLHGIFGGSHEQPQTADNSRNSYSIQAGGGVDYRWNPRVSFRLESDYVRTGFFHQAQNDFEASGGVVFHF